MAAPTAPKSPSSKALNVIYDGTPSAAQMLEEDRLAFETSKRRATAAAMRKIARSRPGEARLYERNLGGNTQVIVDVRRRDGSVMDWLVCDLSSMPREDGQEELTLVVPCPRCVLERGRPAETMLVRQSNRMFSLDPTRAGELWVNPTDPTEVYVIPGTITLHERIECGKCKARWRIDDSVMKRV